MSHLLPAPRGARRAPLQEEGNVGAEPSREVLHLVFREFEPEQTIQTHEESRRVAASAPETRRHGDPLREPYANSSRRVSGRDEIPRALEDVRTVRVHGESARRELEAVAPPLEVELVFERDGLHDGVDLVVAVGTASQDPEA